MAYPIYYQVKANQLQSEMFRLSESLRKEEVRGIVAPEVLGVIRLAIESNCKKLNEIYQKLYLG